MRIVNENLAAIHGYLCSDGYVITNPPTQKHKYYYIGLRNMNSVLLNDFQGKFKKVFGIEPIIYRNERCKTQSKAIYFELVKFGSFYSGKWQLPNCSKIALAKWLRTYFDCDGWVYCKERKNRHIGLDSINEKGILSIKDALKRFGIDCVVKERRNKQIWRLYIYRKESLQKFAKQIGFLHPKKAEKLNKAINSYVDYRWAFPSDNKQLRLYIVNLMKEKAKIKKNGVIRVNSIIKENLIKLKGALQQLFTIEAKVYGPWINGYGTSYYELTIQSKKEVEKAKTLL